MSIGFWGKLKKRDKPIICQAPMADVTDAAFRRLIAKYSKGKDGKLDVMWAEFVSADGLCSAGKNKLLHLLKFSKKEKPIVAQLFGAKPETMRRAAALVARIGFDGIDINMGCPDRAVEKQGGGAALIKNPKLARELIRAAKRGAVSAGRQIPVSVKTRIGYNKNELAIWLPELLAEKPAAIIIHARTRKELSNVPARWEHIREAVAIRNQLKSKTLIIGNGDVNDLANAYEKVKTSGADGAMVGRALFGKPWLFSSRLNLFSDPRFNLSVLLEHTKLFDKILGKHKSFAVMKKHFKSYVTGFPGAKELRGKLMATKNVAEVEKILSFNFI